MKKCFVLILLIISMFFFNCGRKEPFTANKMIMGTVVTISIYKDGKVKNIKDVTSSVFNEMSALNTLWADTGSGSDILKLKDNAGESSIRVDTSTYKLIVNGLNIGEAADGNFNIKIGPITELWGFHQNNPHIPDNNDISARLPLLTGGVYFTSDNVVLSWKGMSLDIGGIGKGFAVDYGVKRLKEEGIVAGIVQAGGDILVFGEPRKDEKWKIGIRHPRNPDGLFGVVEIDSGAITTSGDYQQYFEVDGKRYHHIIDPSTGYPPDKCISVTAMAKECWEADAIATALFVMGQESGMNWLNEHAEYQALFIFYDNTGNLMEKHTAGMKFTQN